MRICEDIRPDALYSLVTTFQYGGFSFWWGNDVMQGKRPWPKHVEPDSKEDCRL